MSDIPPEPPEIYQRIVAAISEVDSPISGSLYLGVSEWEELKNFCEEFDVTWSGGSVEYNPTINGERATIFDCPIFRVDALNHLEAHA